MAAHLNSQQLIGPVRVAAVHINHAIIADPQTVQPISHLQTLQWRQTDQAMLFVADWQR